MSRYRRSLVPGGTFFFTVTLAIRPATLLVDEIVRLRESYTQTMKAFPFETVAICVLPDHLHAIWTLPVADSDYATRWQRIKSGFSWGLPSFEGRSASKIRKREKGIWQWRYWEHQIRDEVDLSRHVDYIHFNPVKHGLVQQVRDWPYSSFHRYVRQGFLPENWGGVEIEGAFGEE